MSSLNFLASLLFSLLTLLTGPKPLASLAAIPQVQAPVTLTGQLSVFQIDPIDGTPPRLEYTLATDAAPPLSVYPTKPINLRSGARVEISGYKLDNIVVVDPTEDNFRIVSSPPPIEAVGNQRLAVLLVDFVDSGPRPFTREEARTKIFSGPMPAFYKEQSYDRISWSGDVYDWYQLPRAGAVNGNCLWPAYQNGVEFAAVVSGAGLDISQYDRVAILANHPCLGGGISSVGKNTISLGGQTGRFSISWIGELWRASEPSTRGQQSFPWTNLDHVLSHELGHGLGLHHANGFDCFASSFYSVSPYECGLIEYGNHFDLMGGTKIYSLHFNAYGKKLLGWAATGDYLTIAESGRYTVSPLESAGPARFAVIDLGASSSPPHEYYLEYRRGLGFDSSLRQDDLVVNQNGLLVNFPFTSPQNVPISLLLDLSPTNLDWEEDTRQAALVGSRIFRDPHSQVAIGPIISVTPGALTFDVGIGEDPCFRFPPLFGSARQNAADYIITTQALSGGTAAVSFPITNQDYVGCGPSGFAAVLYLPPELAAIGSKISAPIVNVNPLETGAVSLKFAVPSSILPGTYQITVKVRNTAGDFSSSAPMNLQVEAGASTLPLPISPPPSRLDDSLKY